MTSNNKGKSTTDIKSHIQMPRLLLKRFHNEHDSFYYYDIAKCCIGTRGTAKSTNVEFGYYSADIEEYLNDNIETPFSQLLNLIDKIDFGKDTFQLPTSFHQTAYNFLYSLIVRDPSMLQAINGSSTFFQFLPPQNRHDYAVVQGMTIAREKQIFSDYLVTFTINETHIPFVLPIGGIYNYSLNRHSIINLPISPQIAISFVHNSYAERLIHNESTVSMFLISDCKKIMQLNEIAFQSQLKQNWGVIITPTKSELERLVALLLPKSM